MGRRNDMEVGDKVKLKLESRYWQQSEGTIGVITYVEESMYLHMEDHPYTVRWENGHDNTYREWDLELQTRPIQGKSKLEFNFLRK